MFVSSVSCLSGEQKDTNTRISIPPLLYFESGQPSRSAAFGFQLSTQLTKTFHKFAYKEI